MFINNLDQKDLIKVDCIYCICIILNNYIYHIIIYFYYIKKIEIFFVRIFLIINKKHNIYIMERQIINSITDAYNACRMNGGINTISWIDNTGTQQVWRSHIKGSMSQDSELIFSRISMNYRDTENGTLWWYLQAANGDILEITTDSSFFSRFCS